mmetsp:Transcript_8370/g.16611  ORF Transcript_8370/g.16611 Transcript_8370/m.16611 type:complete len:244 (+) Transcript_8370:5781-6512(+)|eukprot:CAMPEP_0204907754 /NCGR_PEP_ID=MMETSP1397-20131031/6828_1 /ASSEMBLY_ACC=CAM_ASM_000891 /TAXON_ID=49980 /ORGANISM="Climacostomum Climacostomum virens, Strain Stock W-24" /LENGTH=243 /DNA_ID=CAMNT_0052077009 /DNA_START=181 /DNA_END=912 /DNA_ORIENTATION=-
MRLRRAAKWSSKESDLSCKYSISGSFLFTIASLGMLSALFGNLLLSCIFTIDCTEFWPTVSYVGALNTHDRIFVLACTAFALLLTVLNLSVSLALHQASEISTRLILFLISLTAAGFLITLSVIDEVNGILIHNLEGTHAFMSLSLLIFSFSWGFIVWKESKLTKLQGLTSATQKAMIVCGVLAAATIYEWQFAYTTHSNSFINETVEALCEWCLVVAAVAVPILLAKELPELTVSLSVTSSK